MKTSRSRIASSPGLLAAGRLGLLHLAVGLAGLGLGLSLPAQAGSSAASSASDSVGASVGSLSTSIQQSSQSSTGDKQVAAGDYRIIEVSEHQAAASEPGARTAMLKLRLQAAQETRPATTAAEASAAAEFFLILPAAAYAQSQLGPGQLLTARQHGYGLEFANSATRQPFFLVLEDAWLRELPSRPVTL